MDIKKILDLLDSLLKIEDKSVDMVIRRFASSVRNTDKELYTEISLRLKHFNTLRSKSNIAKPIPVDSDSRLNLIRKEFPVVLDNSPTYPNEIENILAQVILERKNSDKLLRAGIAPTKSIIFQGPPGVGKTLSARWLANKLDLPLLTLDLATVMSSFLGKTGSNVRAVLDYAISYPCVLLLDEFDAVAKRRDDDRELGELKRLVTVLLQAIDDWPYTSLLIAATNHGELLDPAIWRRFDLEISFELPNNEMIGKYLEKYWPELIKNTSKYIKKFEGGSFSDIDRELRREKREKIISKLEPSSCLYIIPDTLEEKKQLVPRLYQNGHSQREISRILGISRPTIKNVIDQMKE